MAFDGAFLHAMTTELRAALADARVDKIHQPAKEELVLALRTRSGAHKLFLSARAAAPRVQLTARTPDNPPAPPMFCMLLRKRLTGARLLSIRQEGFERALALDFQCLSELGDQVTLTLVAELMGRHSNVILVDETGRVVDAIKRVDPEMSSVRPVLPGLPYTPPPAQAGKHDVSTTPPEEFERLLRAGRDEPLADALLRVSSGLSPLLCRETAYLCARGADVTTGGMTGELWQRFRFYLGRIRQAALTGEGSAPYLVCDPQGVPLEYSFVPLTQYGLSCRGREAGSFSELLDTYYEEKDAAERLRQRGHDILRVLTSASDRVARKLDHQREELARSEKREEKRLFGELLHANLYAVERGASAVEVVNYYDPAGASVRIPLNPALTAAQNAQRYYKEYRKAQTAQRVLTEQIAAGEQELQYLDTVFDALSRARTFRELSELREELLAGGYLKRQKGRQKPPPPLGPLRFRSSDGYEILVGRNNAQNDRLTLKTARGSDLWLHTKDIPGSHTVICTSGGEPPERTLREAAGLAALHSKAAHSAQVPVDYTEIRHVHKPAGAPPGRVIYENQRTVYVTPDPALLSLRQPETTTEIRREDL